MSLIQKAPTPLTTTKPMPLMKVPPVAGMTQIIVHYDCGFGNHLFIRGEHGGLNWSAGKPLHNIKASEWTFEIPTFFTECAFKILINDQHYEQGDNHHITCGKVITIEPKF